MKCAEKDNGGGETGQACGSDGDEPCPVDSQCINHVCKTADDLAFTECTYTDPDYCFGNIKVSCDEGSWGNMYMKTTCSEGCELNSRIASCIGEDDDYYEDDYDY